MLLKLIEAFVPESLVSAHPVGYLTKRLRREGNHDFAPAFLAPNKPRSLQKLQVLRHGVQSSVERPRDIQEPCGPVRELPNDRPPRGVRNCSKHIGELIHTDITP